jgi:hypothetical protein
MAVEWYVAFDGCQKGPFSTPEIQRWIREGKVGQDALIKEGPNGAWAVLREVRFLSGRSAWPMLLNLIGIAALLAIGVELYLFMLTHPQTQKFAPWLLGLYLLWMLLQWPRWIGRKKK